MMSFIRVENLTKVFGGYNDEVKQLIDKNASKEEILSQTGSTVAVNNATLDINESEIFVVMGLSGSGKSTLIRLINRLIEPTVGEIHIKDRNVLELNATDLREFRRENFSMVFQSFALFPFRTVLDNAAFGLEVKNIPKQKRRKKAQEALELVGLGEYKNQYPSQLSGGMQQRVGLARALANDTDILLMDEAFSALDPLIRKEMQEELLQLQQDMKKTIIFITHDLNEALSIGDRIALMKDGKIAQIGKPEEIVTNPADDYVRAFVQDIDRSKVLKTKHIMTQVKQPVSIDSTKAQRTIDKNALLSETFNLFDRDHDTLIITDKDSVVGELRYDQVLNVLSAGNEVVTND